MSVEFHLDMGRLDEFRKYHQSMVEAPVNSFERIPLFQEFIDNNTGLNKEMGLFHLAWIYKIYNQLDKTAQILEKLEKSEHPIVLFHTYYLYANYYRGYNNPRIDIDKSQYYLEKGKSILKEIEFENDWERSFTYSKVIEEEYIQEKDLEKKLLILNEAAEIISKVEYGQKWQYLWKLYDGNVYRALGRFSEALENYSNASKFYGSTDLSIFVDENMATTYVTMGNLEMAEKCINNGLSHLKEKSNYFLWAMGSNTKAYIAELNKNYENAEQIRLELVERSLKQENIDRTFIAHHTLFLFYSRMYQISREKDDLDKIIDLKNTLLAFAEKHPDNVTIAKLSDLANALTLKLGGLRDRAKSLDLLEELAEFYPDNLLIKMNLVELYFDDLSSDILGDSKKRIDELLLDIKESSLMTNPTTISENSDYQILVAKYTFYLNGKIEEALKILYDLRSNAEKYELKGTVDKVTSEIDELEGQISKWSNVSLSTKERINKSNLQSYIQMALKEAKQDTI